MRLQAKFRRKLCEALARGLRRSHRAWKHGGVEYVNAKLGAVFDGVGPALEAVAEGWQPGRSVETASFAIADTIIVLSKATLVDGEVREGRSFLMFPALSL